MNGILKVVGAFGFSFIYFALLFVSQITLILIFERKSASKTGWYAALLLIHLVPELIHLLRNIWDASFIAVRRLLEWPRFGQIVAGLLISISVATSVFFLSAVILPQLPGHVCLPILNICLLLELSLSSYGKKNVKTTPISFISISKYVASFFVICCAVVISLNLYHDDFMLHYQAVIFSFLVIISILPSHAIIKRIIYGDTEASYHNSSILYTLLRITFHILFTVKIINYDTSSDLLTLNFQQFRSAFEDLSGDNDLVTLMCIHIVSSFAVQTINFVSCSTKATKLFISLPLIASQILAPISYVTICKYNFIVIGSCTLEWSSSTILLYSMCVLLVILISCVLLIVACLSGNKDLEDLNLTYYHSYNSLFIPQLIIISSGILKYKAGNKNETTPTNRKSTRVYICTTMYQEAEHEMERLLRSLHKVALSRKLQDNKIYLESHIFLDNGADDKEMKDFGKQLLTLVENVFELRPESGLLIYTPYGIQLHWELESGTSLFIHLKDNTKVKAKKRWSQVMYLKYILDFKSRNQGRSLYASRPSDHSFSTQIYTSNESLNKFSDYGGLDDLKSSSHLFVPKAKFRVGDSKTPSYGSMESLNDLTENNDNNLPEPINLHSSSAENGDIPGIVLYPSGDEADDDSADELGMEVSSNDGSMITGDVHANSRELLVSELPTEIHTQASTVFTVSVSRSDISTLHLDANRYILMTDADMSFDDDAVFNVVNTCNSQPEVGGVCGRTLPIGLHIHPIIWLQMFDYAKDFWMIKSSQNVIGSVMCCPGCFSLFRFEALKDVFDTYSRPTETVEDVFTKDNGEDRWMCTLMMLKGWKLRYVHTGRNSTFCPEETTEFMKQRRRWLLSDYANAFVVAKNLINLITKNTSFTAVYILYLLQLFIIMVLYPGSTIMMLSLGLELASGIPLLAITSTFSLVVLGYCLLLLSDQVSSAAHMTISKILILVFGLGTCYIFIAAAISIYKSLYQDYHNQTVSHVEQVILLSLAATYLLAGLLHPSDIYILICGLPYTFYLPFLNIILPVYAICNIVDQSWGTRDNQVAKVPKIFKLPSIKRKKHRRPKTNLNRDKAGSYTSLNSSTLNMRDFNEDEMSFWTRVVDEFIGVNVRRGMTSEEREQGLRKLRKKVVIGFLIANGVWIFLLSGCYAFLITLMDNKTTFSIIILASLGLTPLIQVIGMVVFRFSEIARSIVRLFLLNV